jgi:Tfp pilus assembly protein PilX
VCRDARAHVHHETHGLNVQVVLAALLVLALLALAATHLAR